jgi:orotate phosphoribosyltransferase
MTDAELAGLIREHAYLEGEFVLRSGRRSSYYLDKYRFETQPEVLGPLGERIAAVAADGDGPPDRLAGPELGAVALAAAAALASGIPFLVVRKQTKGYGTDKLVEGLYEPGERVCLVEDVVTTGGAAVDAVGALRAAGLECRRAVCVVDRDEGGADALARCGVRLFALFRAAELAAAESTRKPA